MNHCLRFRWLAVADAACSLGASPLVLCLIALRTGHSQEPGIDPLPELRSREVPVQVNSGTVENQGSEPSVIFSATVAVPKAPWLRLRFDEAILSGQTSHASCLRLTSVADGEMQELNATHLREWGNTSAYFNGGEVHIELIAAPFTGKNLLAMSSVTAGLPDVGGGGSICGATDDRAPSTDARTARLMPIACTAWLINDAAGCFLTAGHCFPTGPNPVCQFNVPLSTAGGGPQAPPVRDQFPVDPASIQSNDDGPTSTGNDWGYFGCFRNSFGETARERQGAAYALAGAPPAVAAPAQTIRITGYGTVSAPNLPRSQTQQTHTGPYAQLNASSLQYQVDTTGGNSGSAVVLTTTGQAIGIHTNAGCQAAAPVGSNLGTRIDNPGLQNALANPLGVCRPCCAGGPVCSIRCSIASWVACPGDASIYKIFCQNSEPCDRTVRWFLDNNPSGLGPCSFLDTMDIGFGAPGSCQLTATGVVTIPAGGSVTVPVSILCPPQPLAACTPALSGGGEGDRACISLRYEMDGVLLGTDTGCVTLRCFQISRPFLTIDTPFVLPKPFDPRRIIFRVRASDAAAVQNLPFELYSTDLINCSQQFSLAMDPAATVRIDSRSASRITGQLRTIAFGEDLEINVDLDREAGPALQANEVFLLVKDPTAESGDLVSAIVMIGGTESPSVPFHRGDADDNGSVQLTDAVRILGFLFLGQEAPSCLDAADTDDSGVLLITDAIRILGFLFLGGPPPAPPGPPSDPCGVDAAGDLGCVSYTHC